MNQQFVIDCGSRSIKLHEARRGAVTLRATRSWDPISDGASVASVGALLFDLARDVLPAAPVHVVGTAAARRDPAVAGAIGQACSNLGWTYETLSHSEEARLIRQAFGAQSGRDIINVGGGSIQVVPVAGDPALLGFGITDLNRRFGLSDEPAGRQVAAATAFVRDALPEMSRPFIYSGGELSYLRALGAELGDDGRCTASEFERVAGMADAMSIEELEAVSPFDPGWVRGAVASNVIVRACLGRSAGDHYYASDINIGDGIIAALAGRTAHATDPGF